MLVAATLVMRFLESLFVIASIGSAALFTPERHRRFENALGPGGIRTLLKSGLS
jgi:hypothetical protein